MISGLAVSDVVNVTASLAPLASPLRGFGVPLFLDSTQGVVDVSERMRLYSNINQVLADWPINSGAYKAALAFFSQSPQPAKAYLGVWAQTATAGVLHGALLTPAQQVLANFTAISAGAMSGFIDSKPFSISGLNFSAVTNLNGVASALQTALQASFAGALVIWNAALGRFDIYSGTTGVASAVGYFTAPAAFNSAAFSGQPTAADTLTVNGTAVTFVASGATGNQVNIGASLAATLTALAAMLNSSVDANIVKGSYSVVGSNLYMVSKLTGVAGNAYTLAKVSTAITVGGATWSGGSGTDCSATLGLSLAAGASLPVAGIAAETPLQAATIVEAMSNDWYALQFCSNTQPSDADHQAVASFVEAAVPDRTYWLTTQAQTALDPTNSSDIASALKTLMLSRTSVLYNSSSLVAVASLFGRQASVDFSASNTTINLMWKILPGIAPDYLTETQAAALLGKNANFYAYFNNQKAIVQKGQMVNGDYIDERVGIDWLKNLIQTTLWNLLYQSPTKIPQTDDGTQQLLNAAKTCLQQAVVNGLLAPGVWNGPAIGQLKTGDTLATGWYAYAPLVASQAQADREARKAVPIQIACKFAGAVDTVSVAMTFNR